MDLFHFSLVSPFCCYLYVISCLGMQNLLCISTMPCYVIHDHTFEIATHCPEGSDCSALIHHPSCANCYRMAPCPWYCSFSYHCLWPEKQCDCPVLCLPARQWVSPQLCVFVCCPQVCLYWVTAPYRVHKCTETAWVTGPCVCARARAHVDVCGPACVRACVCMCVHARNIPFCLSEMNSRVFSRMSGSTTLQMTKLMRS